MSVRLILPKDLVLVATKSAKIFFLAGPVRGGGDWQRKAIELISQRAPNSYVVCPCRYDANDPIRGYAMRGVEDVFVRQTLWERHYLDLASKKGAIMFWLGCEDKDNPRNPKDGPYGRDTYGELGEWRMRAMYEHARIVVGAEPNFSGLSVIEANFHAALGKDFPFYTNLSDTVYAAITRAYAKR